MKTLKFENREQWLDARLGRITGTRLKDLVDKRGTGKRKKGFYEIIAERVAIPASDENVMDRGLRLEDIAMQKFSEITQKKVNTDLVIWCREDDENIAISPDGIIGKTEAIECKCLNSASHLEAWLTKEIPNEYEYQVLQYFIVNDELQTLYFLFYDPRMPKDIFWIEVTRESKQEEIKEYIELEHLVLAQVAQIEAQLTF